MTGKNCDLFTHSQSRSYLNHLVCPNPMLYAIFIDILGMTNHLFPGRNIIFWTLSVVDLQLNQDIFKAGY